MKAYFATEFTDIRLISIMYSSVGVEGRRAIKCFAASRTFMGFVLCVNDLMATESRCLTKSFATNFADERTSSGVHWHVSREIVMCIKDLPTFRTCEGLWFADNGTRWCWWGRRNWRHIWLRRLNVTVRWNRFLISRSLEHCFSHQLAARRRWDFLMSAWWTVDTFNWMTLIMIRLNGEIG